MVEKSKERKINDECNGCPTCQKGIFYVIEGVDQGRRHRVGRGAAPFQIFGLSANL